MVTNTGWMSNDCLLRARNEQSEVAFLAFTSEEKNKCLLLNALRIKGEGNRGLGNASGLLRVGLEFARSKAFKMVEGKVLEDAFLYSPARELIAMYEHLGAEICPRMGRSKVAYYVVRWHL